MMPWRRRQMQGSERLFLKVDFDLVFRFAISCVAISGKRCRTKFGVVEGEPYSFCKTGSGSLTAVLIRVRRAVRGPDAGEALGLGFDHRAKVVATQRPLLLKVGSDGFQIVVG